MESLSKLGDTVFLALVLWREARGEPLESKIAVAFTILNRVAKPCWWGNSVLSVVTKKYQYSSMTDPKDIQLTIWPKEYNMVWLECLQIARDLLHNVSVNNPVPNADSYYDISLDPDHKPTWASDKAFVAQIGRLKFYNVDFDHETAASTLE